MPHFIIDCSESIIQQKSPDEIMKAVYETAEATGLFAENDIKVTLTKNGTEINTLNIQNGEAVFSNLEVGTYTVNIGGVNKEIIIKQKQ